MKAYILEQLKKGPLFTIAELEKNIKTQKGINRQEIAFNTLHQGNLKIVSPFYERTNHRPQCKCQYHNKLSRGLRKPRLQTEPNQNRGFYKPSCSKNSSMERENQQKIEKFEERVKNQNGSKFLKGIIRYDNVQRHSDLDCHNHQFELYLQMLQKQNKGKIKNLRENYDQDIVNNQQTKLNTTPNFTKKDKVRKQDFILQLQPRSTRGSSPKSMKLHPSMKQVEWKKGKSGTGKNIRFQQKSTTKKQRKSKGYKSHNSRNSSFFNLEDQQNLLKYLCKKLKSKNKRNNKEAEMILKQISNLDIAIYEKVLHQMEGEIKTGLKLRNLDDDDMKVLVKIIMGRLQKQVKSAKGSHEEYSRKNKMINSIFNKFGWPLEDSMINLEEFWQSRLIKLNSRSSFASSSSRRSSAYSNHNISYRRNSRDSRMKSKRNLRESGFALQRNKTKKLTTFNLQPNVQKPLQQKKDDQFKFGQSKPTIKKGALIKRQRFKKHSIFKDSFNQFSSTFKKGPFASLQSQVVNSDLLENEQNKFMSNQSHKIIPIKEQLRSQSICYNPNSQVQKHIEINKKFLKRVEHDLVEFECENLVINMKQSIITKKRKIRAIHKALQSQEMKKSEYYNDILRYLEIYEEYCNLVTSKKQKKIKSENAINKLDPFKAVQQKDPMDLGQVLDDLHKQRELKYINLMFMEQNQDPKQELILNIPQYITKNLRERSKIEQINSFSHFYLMQDYHVYPEQIKMTIDSALMQTKLEHLVNLDCRMCLGQSTPIQQKELSAQKSLSKSVLELKLQRYKNMLLKKL